MNRLQRVGVLSFASFMAITSALVALVLAFFYAVIFVLLGAGAALGGGEGAGALLGGGLLGAAAVVVLAPLAYAVFGFLFGLLYAVVLNLALRILGGLELEIT